MQPHIERMHVELDELKTKTNALMQFTSNPKPMDISHKQWNLMKDQLHHMAYYAKILAERLEVAANE